MLLVVGSVGLDRDEEEEISAVWIEQIEGGSKVHLQVDANARKLASGHENARVQAAGTYENKDGETWLVLRKFAPLVKMKGELEVEEDEDGNAAGATLKVEQGETTVAHPVMLDKKGKALMRDMAWETVEAEGMLYTRNGKKWLRVYAFEKVEKEEVPEEDDGGWDEDEGDEEDEEDGSED
jgi:hypothetical protein